MIIEDKRGILNYTEKSDVDKIVFSNSNLANSNEPFHVPRYIKKNFFGTLAYYCRQNQMRYSESPLLQLTFFVDMQGEEVSMRDEGQVFVLEGISTKTWLIL